MREWVLSKIQVLFELEEKAWLQTPEERVKLRGREEVSIINELTERIKKRLVEGRVLSKSKFKEALGYYCSLIPYLKNYIKYPNARMDNNVAERALRPLAIGKKTGYFLAA